MTGGTVVCSSPTVVGGTHQVVLKDLTSGARTPLTARHDVEHTWPVPSPDGRRILFYRADKGQSVNDIATNSLWVMDADGTNMVEILPRGTDGWARQGHAEWSPDGTRILFAAGSNSQLDLWTCALDGTDRRLVVRRGKDSIDPSWAPNGDLVYVGADRRLWLAWLFDQEVWSSRSDGTGERRWTRDSNADFDPFVSPDGRRVVWLRMVSVLIFWSRWSLMTADITAAGETTNTRPLLDDGAINGAARWSPDGRRLVFSRSEAAKPDRMSVATITAEGVLEGYVGGTRSPFDEQSPAWMPT